MFISLRKERQGLSHDYLAHLVLSQELSLDDLTIFIPLLVLVALSTLVDRSMTLFLTSLAGGRRDEVKELDKVTRVKSITVSRSLLYLG